MSKALSVIVDDSNRMIAAVLEINGEITTVTKNKLSYFKETIKLDNAIIDYAGNIRAKRGSLPRITKEEYQKQYKVEQNADNIDLLLYSPKFEILRHNTPYTSMLWVAEVKQGGNDILVKSSNGRQKLFDNRELAKIMEERRIKIAGASLYNHKVDCTVITPDKPQGSIVNLIENWKKLHNPWEGNKVRDWLSAVSVGTKLIIESYDKSQQGTMGYERYRDMLIRTDNVFTKLDWNKWKWECQGNPIAISGFANEIGDDSYALDGIEISCVYQHKYNIAISTPI